MIKVGKKKRKNKRLIGQALLKGQQAHTKLEGPRRGG